MQLFAARLALLAYLVGGLAIPAMHQHGLGHPAAGHTHRGHFHSHSDGHSDGAHSHAGDSQRAGVCCHTTPPAACEVAEEQGLAVEQGSASADRVVSSTAVAATVPHSSTCGEDCVVCGFLGSAQASFADAPPMLVPEPLRRVAAIPQGPGFDAADLRIDRLRGPPRGVILG